jgi:hypothetical protein
MGLDKSEVFPWISWFKSLYQLIGDEELTTGPLQCIFI